MSLCVYVCVCGIWRCPAPHSDRRAAYHSVVGQLSFSISRSFARYLSQLSGSLALSLSRHGSARLGGAGGGGCGLRVVCVLLGCPAGAFRRRRRRRRRRAPVPQAGTSGPDWAVTGSAAAADTFDGLPDTQLQSALHHRGDTGTHAYSTERPHSPVPTLAPLNRSYKHGHITYSRRYTGAGPENMSNLSHWLIQPYWRVSDLSVTVCRK